MLRRALPFALVLVACSSAPEDRLGTTSEALTTVCGAKPTDPVQGRDVSYYQGNFDWNAQKGAGVDFGYARVSDGTGFIDPQFGNNWKNMKAAGVLRGAYMFFEPGQDATAQANLMVQKVGMLGDGDLPCMIDVEATGGQSPATIASKIKTWLDIVEKGTGRRPWIYTGAYFWQDYVQSTAFGNYPLWIANYGATCPLVPNGWKTWLVWQYSDGGGKLDHDVFNGTLQQLQAYAHPPNTPPRGNLDAVDCTGIDGWAQDEDSPMSPIDVHLYFDGAAGSMAKAVSVRADDNRADLCKAIGSCDHGFTLKAPRSLLDGKAHKVYAYGIDSMQGTNPQLDASPKSFTCNAPPLGDTVRRWITSQEVLDAWKLDRFMDIAHYPDAALATIAKGADVPLAPKLAQGDDGSPEIWVLDGNVKRHVQNPQSLAAWRFDTKTVMKMPAAQLKAIAQGPEWPLEPLLVQGDGPEVDMLDVRPQSANGPGPGPGPGPGNNGDGEMKPQGGGCNTSGGHANAAWFVLALVLLARKKSVAE